MTGNAAVNHFKTYQLAGHAFLLLLLQLGAVDEVLAFHEFGNPTQSSLDGRGRIVQIIAIQAEAHLQAERVTRPQSNRFDAKLGTSLEDGLPNLHGCLRVEIKLKATGTGIAGIGNNHIRLTGKLTMCEVIVGNGRQIYGGQFL